MAVVDCEVGASWPIFDLDVRPRLRRQEICDDRDSVLVVVPYEALVRVRRVGSHDTCSLVRRLCWFIIWNYDLERWLDIYASFTLVFLGFLWLLL